MLCMVVVFELVLFTKVSALEEERKNLLARQERDIPVEIQRIRQLERENGEVWSEGRRDGGGGSGISQGHTDSVTTSNVCVIHNNFL